MFHLRSFVVKDKKGDRRDRELKGTKLMTKKSTENPNPMPSLSIDWDLYGSMLEDSDLSDEQKRELIESLWSIVVTFVDLGFGLHPIQQVCGEDDDNLAKAIADMVSSSHTNNNLENISVPHNDGSNKGSL